jgi:hypothetical protein
MPGQRQRILALSGGGAYGAYTVGFLAGWTRSGARPEFDVVTGISTGGLIATYAFLGPRYDAALADLYTGVTSRDIYRKRPWIVLPFADSVASSEPMQRLIAARVDARLLNEVAREHGRGRRLYVGTTDLDRRRFVVWDMGRVASSGRPDAVDLYRTILLASASVPGFFPPVPIDCCPQQPGRTELHADGGASRQVFVPGRVSEVDGPGWDAGRASLAGSSVYILLAGKVYADPVCVQPRLKDIAGSALKSLIYSETRNDLYRIWTLCRATGMGYRLAAIPQDVPISQDSLSFEPAEMRALYDLGCCDGVRRAWRTTAPDSARLGAVR